VTHPPLATKTDVDQSPADGRTRRVLVFLASALWAALAFFLFILPLTPARMARPAAELIDNLALWRWVRELPIPAPSEPAVLALWLALFGGAACLIYGGAVYWSWRRPASRATEFTALGIGLLLCFSSVLALPTFNTDIYNYIIQGRVMTAHSANPHYAAADQFPDDRMHKFASPKYTKVPNDYLPAWSLLNFTLSRIGGDDPVRILLTYRLGLFLLTALNLLLILGILRAIAPQRVLSGLIVYGWHPVVALEASSRVDIPMAFCLLLAVFLLVHGRRLLATTALTLSAFTKWITLPILAMHVLSSVATRQWRRLAIDLLVCAVTATIIYLPFTIDASIFKTHFDMLMRGGSSAPAQLKGFLLVGFAITVLLLARKCHDDLNRQLPRWAIVMLVFVALMSKIGYGWYVITPMALVCLVPDGRLVAIAVSLGTAAFAFQWRDNSFDSAFPLPNMFALHRYWTFLLLAAVAGIAGFFTLRQSRASLRVGRRDHVPDPSTALFP
jgi:hypothetical protein